jgi:hypothetical protein
VHWLAVKFGHAVHRVMHACCCCCCCCCCCSHLCCKASNMGITQLSTILVYNA